MKYSTYVISLVLLSVLFACSEPSDTPEQEKAKVVSTAQNDKTAPALSINESDANERIDSAKILPANEKYKTRVSVDAEVPPKTIPKPVSSTTESVKKTKVEEKKKREKKGRAKAVFNNMEHEFGVINQGDVIKHDFVFENTGNAELDILNVDVTCGCTVPVFPIIPIGPGEKGTISVTYNSTGKLGNQRPMITVITNAQPRTYKLYLKGVVDAERAKDSKSSDPEENER